MPRTYTTGEIITKAILDTHVRDNLRYLKGLDGEVTIEDDIILATGKALQTATGAGNSLLVQAYDTDTGPAYQTFITLTAGGTPSCELDACILDTSVAKGTWTASGTWTIPAVTLGGAVAGGDQAFTNVGDMTFAAGSFLASGGTNTNTLLLKANDTTFITLTTGATDTCEIANATLTTPILASLYQASGGGLISMPASVGADTICLIGATQELDNKTLDTSVAKGTWTASGTWTIPAITLGGAITAGAQQIIWTSVALVNTEEDVLAVRDETNASDKVLQCSDFQPSGGIGFRTDAQFINAPNSDNGYIMLKARDNGVGQIEIARLVGAADPYLQATLPLRFSPIATASLPGTPVEGMLTYDATLDRITYRDASAWAVVTKEGHGPAEHADQTRELFISAGAGMPSNGATLDPDAVGLPVITLTDAADESAGFGFKVPDDFVSYSSLKVVWKCSAVSGNMYWYVDAHWGASTESSVNTSELGVVGVTATGGNNILNVQEPLTAVVFSGLALGDYVTVYIQRTGTHASDTLSAAVEIVGILFTYVASQ